MKIARLFTDDEAVSQVVGLVLVVAIVVVLSALVGSAVLGIGQQESTVQPQASFEITYSSGSENPGAPAAANISSEDGVVTITHKSGDEIDPATLYIRGEDVATGNWVTVGGEASGVAGSSSRIIAGDIVTVEARNDYTVELVWDNGDSSALLATDERSTK